MCVRHSDSKEFCFGGAGHHTKVPAQRRGSHVDAEADSVPATCTEQLSEKFARVSEKSESFQLP